MLYINYLKDLFLISIALSTITCTFIQKTKMLLKTSKYITLYSLIMNLLSGIVFCKTFTNIPFPNSLWVGLFSFLGADSIYKKFEGKLYSHSDLRNKIFRKKKSTEIVDKN